MLREKEEREGEREIGGRERQRQIEKREDR